MANEILTCSGPCPGCGDTDPEHVRVVLRSDTWCPRMLHMRPERERLLRLGSFVYPLRWNRLMHRWFNADDEWCPTLPPPPLPDILNTIVSPAGAASFLDQRIEQLLPKTPTETNQALVLLRRLVAAKNEKDQHGETATYHALKDGAWEESRVFLATQEDV